MLDGPFKAAMGITAYVLIVFVKACELGLGGAITLADVRERTGYSPRCLSLKVTSPEH